MRPADRQGWIAYCLKVFLPLLIVFGLSGLASSHTHGVVRAVFGVLAVLFWAAAIAALFHGRNRYFRRDS